MSYWKCGICNKEFENYQAQGFDGIIYCPLCYHIELNRKLQEENKALKLNSIPKSNIEDKLNQITKEYVDYEEPCEDYKKEYNLSFVRSAQYNSMRCVLEELLRGEE